MKNFSKTTLQILFSTVLLCLILEGFFRLAGTAPGAGRFVEKIIIKEKLSPKKPAGEFRFFT